MCTAVQDPITCLCALSQLDKTYTGLQTLGAETVSTSFTLRRAF